MTTGSYLKKCREGLKLTQKQVANKLGFDSPQYISNIERDVATPPTKTILTYAQIVEADCGKLAKLMTRAYGSRIKSLLQVSNG